MIKKLQWFIVLVVCFGVQSCNKNPLLVDVSDQFSTVKIKRYEQALYSLDKSNFDQKLPELIAQYPAFLEGDPKDALFLSEVKKMVFYPLNQKLYEDLNQRMSADKMKMFEEDMEHLIKHLNYYYPSNKFNTLYTFISGLGYEQGDVFINDSTIVVAIDLFLGSDYELYNQYGLYKYQTKKMTPEYMSVAVARTLADYFIDDQLNTPTLLEEMILLGKRQYFIEAMLPEKPSFLHLGYTTSEFQYCEENTYRLWRYLIDKQLLYSKDHMETKRFIEDGPFTSSLERESPGRIGAYVGLQIVKEYVRKTGASLKEVIAEKDLLYLFEQSKYRP